MYVHSNLLLLILLLYFLDNIFGNFRHPIFSSLHNRRVILTLRLMIKLAHCYFSLININFLFWFLLLFLFFKQMPHIHWCYFLCFYIFNKLFILLHFFFLNLFFLFGKIKLLRFDLLISLLSYILSLLESNFFFFDVIKFYFCCCFFESHFNRVFY